MISYNCYWLFFIIIYNIFDINIFIFILTNHKYNNWHYYLVNTLPKNYLEEKFDDEIKEVSQEFITIYNQSLRAETIGLNKIAWVWFRKSLEFLIKDYLISITPEDQHETIRNKFLNNCIRDNISNINIKTVASRAVWLGNDETHYTRKWEDKDINDLKSIIELTLHWIESEIRTQKLLEDMPEFRWNNLFKIGYKLVR